MSLPLELQKLPPQALDVIRYLDGKESGANFDSIMDGTGLSDRSMGKAIRGLVTRYYASMPSQGVYVLTPRGRQAADELRALDQTLGTAKTAPKVEPVETPVMETPAVREPAPAPAPAPTPVPAPAAEKVETPAAAVRHARRLSVLMAQEVVVGSSAKVMIGFDAPSSGTAPLPEDARVVIRVSTPGCEVEPSEQPLEISAHKAAGPAQFRLIPYAEGQVRVTVEVFQLVAPDDLRAVGGMYFDVAASPFPTMMSAQLQTLGAVVQLYRS